MLTEKYRILPYPLSVRFIELQQHRDNASTELENTSSRSILGYPHEQRSIASIMSNFNSKPVAGAAFPAFNITLTSGETRQVGEASGRWQLVVVYRGKHCGRCKKYLGILENMQSAWNDAGFDIVVVSADPLEKVEADLDAFGWTFPIGYDLSLDTMKKLGVYISDPLTPDETDRQFSEPAVFCLRPDGTIQIAAISNGPSARPDLAELLDGMIFTIEHDKPARGTVA